MFVVSNTGEQMKAKQFGAMMNTFANQKDYIIKDIGEEFECLYQGGTLDIQVGTGQAIIGGRSITAEESNSLTLPANSTIYLCLRIDLTQVEGQVGLLYANTSSAISQDNLNDNASGVRDLLLAIVETDSNGIVSVEDKRTIKDSAGGISYIGKVEINTIQTENEMKVIFGDDTSWQLLASKLPIGENVFGNGKTLGLTDGTNINGLTSVNASGTENSILYAGEFGKNIGSNTSQKYFDVRKSLGVPSKEQLDNGSYPYDNTGLKMETANVNIWLRTA